MFRMEIVVRAGVEHVHGPGHGAIGAGLGLLQAEHGVEHLPVLRLGQRAEALAAPAHQYPPFVWPVDL